MAARKRRFNTKKERARRFKVASVTAWSAKGNKLPKYEVSPFGTPKRVAEDYRKYARQQLKMARADERFVHRLIHGLPEPGRVTEPWMLRKHYANSRLVLRYKRSAARARENARKALEAARNVLKEESRDKSRRRVSR